VDFAVQAEARGTKVHYLNIGQPDVHSPKAFWEAVQHSGLKTLEYSHSAGIASLRAALSEHYLSRGIDVKPSEVLVTNGGSEAALFAFQTCLDPGDEVIVSEPFYANYAGFAVAAGVTLRPLTTSIENDFRLPSPREIEAVITDRTKAILLCNPSNPTGTVFGADELHEIARIAVEHDLFLIGDEVYRDFYYGDSELVSVLQLPGLENRAIMLDSASKKYSLCGSRVGFFVTKNPEILQAALKFGQARLSAPTLDMVGVEASLRETPASYFADVRAEYVARRDVLVSGLRRIPGVRVPTISGAFYALVELPIDDCDRFCQWMVEEFSYEGETVLMAPATGFYITPGLGRREVRIAYVLDQARLARAVKCLEAGLAAYPGRRTSQGATV
jgi:aspartate aminotransferase